MLQGLLSGELNNTTEDIVGISIMFADELLKQLEK
jgi:hypothetical protein